jgi:hypothetical protein
VVDVYNPFPPFMIKLLYHGCTKFLEILNTRKIGDKSPHGIDGYVKRRSNVR